MNALKKLVADFRDDPLAWRKLSWELADMALTLLAMFMFLALAFGPVFGEEASHD